MSDTGTIADLVRKLEVLSSPEFREGLAIAMGGKAKELIDQDFAQGKSPYDTWRPRKGNYPWPPLQKSKTGRRGWTLRANAQGFILVNEEADYLRFQHYGTKTIDPRELFPVEAFGLGSWREPLDRACADHVRKLMR